MEKIKILGARVLLKPMNEQHPSGFVIPDRKDKATVGIIVKVGDGQQGDKTIHMNVKEGDKVLYHNWSGKEIKTSDGIVYLDMKYEDIVGIIEE